MREIYCENWDLDRRVGGSGKKLAWMRFSGSCGEGERFI
jgi:hypothetical protein